MSRDKTSFYRGGNAAVYYDNFIIIELSILPISSHKEIAFSVCCTLKYSSSLHIISCVHTSEFDPLEIPKKLIYSFFVFLEFPSAIFEGTEITALLI